MPKKGYKQPEEVKTRRIAATVEGWRRRRAVLLEERLVNDGIRHSGNWRQTLKGLLIAAGLRHNRCETCGLGPEWNGKPLVLQIDHVNGDSGDHRDENIRISCPNCHSQTPT